MPKKSNIAEQNNIQNLFLKKEHIEKFLRYTYKGFKWKDNISYQDCLCQFESLFNWDVTIETHFHRCVCDWDKKEKGSTIDDVYCDCLYSGDCLIDLKCYIKIQTFLDDEYPSILRKINSQNEKTKIRRSKDRQGCGFDHSKYDVILLVKEFKSDSTSKEQLIEIFKKSQIKIVFVNNVFDHLNDTPVEESIADLREKIQKLEDENVLLRNALKQLDIV